MILRSYRSGAAAGRARRADRAVRDGGCGEDEKRREEDGFGPHHGMRERVWRAGAVLIVDLSLVVDGYLV